MEREKRKKNITLRDIKEPTADSAGDKKQEDINEVKRILGLDDGDIEQVYRAGKLEDATEEDPTPRARPLVIRLKTPEMATAMHGYGRGRKFRDPDSEEDIWVNPDLIDCDRKANYLARKERNKRKRGHFLVQT